MNETVQRLVDAIKTGDAIATENAFADAMAEKLSSKIEDLRVNIAQSMFVQPEAQVQEELVISEDEWDALSEEEKSQYDIIEEGMMDTEGKVVKKVAKKGYSK